MISLIAIFVGSCAVKNDKMSSCQNLCKDTEGIKKYMNNKDIGNYNIVCSNKDCTFERGLNVKLRAKINDGYVDFNENWGWCSAAGTSCGANFCMKSYSQNNDILVESVKELTCNRQERVLRRLDFPDQHTDPIHNSSAQAMDDCLNRGFETVSNGSHTFSYKLTDSGKMFSISVKADCSID